MKEGNRNVSIFLNAAYEYLIKCQINFIENIILYNQAIWFNKSNSKKKELY